MFARFKGVLGGSLGLAIGLIVLFFITMVIVKYVPAPINKVGTFVEKYAQPHS